MFNLILRAFHQALLVLLLAHKSNLLTLKNNEWTVFSLLYTSFPLEDCLVCELNDVTKVNWQARVQVQSPKPSQKSNKQALGLGSCSVYWAWSWKAPDQVTVLVTVKSKGKGEYGLWAVTKSYICTQYNCTELQELEARASSHEIGTPELF